MAKQSIKLFSLAVAMILLGFLPFLLLVQSKFMAPAEQGDRLRRFYRADNLYSLHYSPKSTIHLEVYLSSHKVALYQDRRLLKTYSIAIGRKGWETPTGKFFVSHMVRNPRWIHPFTDEVISAKDPRNPLGGYWIGFWSDGRNVIGFHGTPDPSSVGSAVSHGCIRMYNHDIEELFHQVQLNTLVIVKS
jgi:lipoprotein-anchoring transpeptidase ErfK/SrfK